MHINISEIKECLDKTSEIEDHYEQLVLASDRIPRSVEDLMWICEQYLQLNIKYRQLDKLKFQDAEPEQWSIRGFYILNETGAEIYLLEGLNYCWQRFILCKELFHVILDKEKYRSIDIHDHIKEVASTFPIKDSYPKGPVVSEQLAEVAAMEFLFPYKMRKSELENSDEIDFYKIAKHYRIPQYLVEEYLSDDVMKNLEVFHE